MVLVSSTLPPTRLPCWQGSHCVIPSSECPGRPDMQGSGGKDQEVFFAPTQVLKAGPLVSPQLSSLRTQVSS